MEIHARFAHLRFGRREQFRPGREIFDFIGKPLLASSDPDSVEDMPSRTVVAVIVRGCDEYKKAIEQLAEFDGKSVSGLVDHAVRAYLRSIGFSEVIPKR
jgi:hypothetical protein